MTHPKSMSRQQLELGLCLFLQCIGCQKREQILVLRFSSASFWVSTIPGHCSSTNSFNAWVMRSVRALNMCRSVLAPIQAVIPWNESFGSLRDGSCNGSDSAKPFSAHLAVRVLDSPSFRSVLFIRWILNSLECCTVRGLIFLRHFLTLLRESAAGF